jgi:alanyl-tRNA synthetase
MTATQETAANGEEIPSTEMIYYTYDGNFQMDCNAQVLSCQLIDDKTVQVCLDKTVMHAQGGGQPTDKGYISISASDGAAVDVTKVLVDRSTGVATHTGTIQPPHALKVGDAVYVKVDEENRRLLSECVSSTGGRRASTAIRIFLKPIASTLLSSF